MPEFFGDRQEYSWDDQFGAEKAYYFLEIAPPNPDLTKKAANYPPEPAKDLTEKYRASRDAAFHPDYEKTVLSDRFASWFDAKENDWILIAVRDSASGHEHGFYTRVERVVRPGDLGYRELLIRISAKDIQREFEIVDKVFARSPQQVRLRAKYLRGGCYDSFTKTDISVP
jgi:hypothetical protein